jgi:hypothetical protein
MSRYQAIADYLSRQRVGSVRLSFRTIERLIGTELPKSAWRHNAWWANSRMRDSHTWAHAWMRAGWKMAGLDLVKGSVTFERLPGTEQARRGKSNVRLISVNEDYWDGIPDKLSDVTNELLPASKNAVPYTFTGEVRPNLQANDTLVFRYKGLLLGEGRFLRWDKSDTDCMIFRPLLQYRERLIGSEFFNFGASSYAFIPEPTIRAIRKAASNDSGPYTETGEAQSITTHRIGQGKVRRSALDRYEKRCCLCSIDEPRLLVAGHIQGWAKGENARGDAANVILMCAFHDSLFGNGFITLTPTTYNLRISQKKLSAGAQEQIKKFTSKFRKPISHPPKKEFLEWHQLYLFEKEVC